MGVRDDPRLQPGLDPFARVKGLDRVRQVESDAEAHHPLPDGLGDLGVQSAQEPIALFDDGDLDAEDRHMQTYSQPMTPPPTTSMLAVSGELEDRVRVVDRGSSNGKTGG